MTQLVTSRPTSAALLRRRRARHSCAVGPRSLRAPGGAWEISCARCRFPPRREYSGQTRCGVSSSVERRAPQSRLCRPGVGSRRRCLLDGAVGQSRGGPGGVSNQPQVAVIRFCVHRDHDWRKFSLGDQALGERQRAPSDPDPAEAVGGGLTDLPLPPKRDFASDGVVI
jgi:hypothetical protein